MSSILGNFATRSCGRGRGGYLHNGKQGKYIINTTTICVLFYCTCLLQFSLRVPTSSFSDKARAVGSDFTSEIEITFRALRALI